MVKKRSSILTHFNASVVGIASCCLNLFFLFDISKSFNFTVNDEIIRRFPDILLMLSFIFFFFSVSLFMYYNSLYERIKKLEEIYSSNAYKKDDKE
ncbi:MAG: hypothetical protein M0R46_09440 [Candidatus Muirbacterium halophilum]|nr:hypothetical protein [Candidatus Muirbacterium halophilum]